jgi:hypothetical protein
MPVHWIHAQTLWFPPAGKSESSTQLVDKITWRQYEIRCAYWETRTHNKKEAGNRAHELRKKEEMDSIDTTDSDIPLVSRQQNAENARTDEQTMPKPPSAPNVIYQIPRRKPPPSEHLVHLVRSKKRCQSPASDDEEGDSTWCQPLKKKMDNHFIIQQRRTPLQDGTSALNVTVCQDETSGLVPPQRDLNFHSTNHNSMHNSLSRNIFCNPACTLSVKYAVHNYNERCVDSINSKFRTAEYEYDK